MERVKQEFELRRHEVDNYLNFVRGIDKSYIKLKIEDLLHNDEPLPDKVDLLRTLKANAYLLLYNLVESTMTSALDCIFDELKTKRVHFDDCRDEIRLMILRKFRNRNPESLIENLNELARDIIHNSFVAQGHFSGNLDARKMSETAVHFGYGKLNGKKYWKLVEIKRYRNDLAHGIKSFAEVGRDASFEKGLDVARDQVVQALEETINLVEEYLSNELYLKKNFLRSISPQEDAVGAT